MKQVSALVVYPVEVFLETDLSSLEEAQLQDHLWKGILQKADSILASGEANIAPVIVSCSEPMVIPKANCNLSSEITMPETQSDWMLIALKALQQTKQSLQPALAARAILKSTVLGERMTLLDQELRQILQELVNAMSPRLEIDLEVGNEIDIQPLHLPNGE